jgi:hypothetical protein
MKSYLFATLQFFIQMATFGFVSDPLDISYHRFIKVIFSDNLLLVLLRCIIVLNIL